MNLDYYKTFYYVALSKNFTRAAELLGNNQPNVTRSMNNLEAELGCRLFARSNRGVSLTPIGEKLFEYVSAAMNNLEQGEEEFFRDLYQKRGFSARGYGKVLKVARTIADMEGSELIRHPHLCEAIGYRSLEEKYWNGN